jgi:ammonia channel protein AmtB
VKGVIKGDWGQLGAQAVGAVTIIVVCGTISCTFFALQNKFTKGGIRSKAEDEIVGLDLAEMGVLAYPEFSGSHK